ncbi:hypothetical protein PG989_001304 [Apiospora arundinis]
MENSNNRPSRVRGSRSPECEQPLLPQRPNLSPRPQGGILAIACVPLITLINCFLGGAITIAIPDIANELGISPELELWPISIFSLTGACTLLICGSLSDHLGCRRTLVLGCILQALACMACGLSRTGPQIIAFRGISGFAASLCLPSATSIIYDELLPGKRRNIALAFMGGGQPVGFALGITLGGLLATTWGWQWGFHIVAIACAVIAFAAASQWSMVAQIDYHRLFSDIDWLGASVASGSIALLLWGFLDVTRNASNAFDLRTGALFVTSGALMVVFVRWQARQQAHGLPRLIDRSMWENRSFWALCASNFIIWGTFNACEQLINLIFQEVQGKSAIEASLMFLPTPISAIIYDIIIGLILHRVSGTLIVASTNLLASFTPLMLALLDATWSYWSAIFPALLLSSVASDASFCVANTQFEEQFPGEMKGLASGDFHKKIIYSTQR